MTVDAIVDEIKTEIARYECEEQKGHHLLRVLKKLVRELETELYGGKND